MTKTVTTGKATDLITFTRSTTGTYLDSVKYGDELITNGTFDTDSDWSDPQNNWTISDGVASMATTPSYTPFFQYGLGTEQGKRYVLTFDVIALDGNLKVDTCFPDGGGIGNDTYYVVSTTGRHTWYFTGATGSDGIGMSRHTVASSCTIDNVSVKEIIGNQGTSGEPLLRTADTNEPRIEYDADGNLKGLLIEEQRTNNLPHSNNASYLARGAPISGENSYEVQAPSNTETVIKLNKTGSGYGYARFSYPTLTSAQTFSVFVKKGTARYVGLRQLSTAGSHLHTTFDLETNTWVQTGYSDSRGYQDYGDGWLRLWVTDNSNTKSWASVAIVGADGNENNGQTGTLYVYGFQREAGSFPTSYIPTSGSTVTRTSEQASLNASLFEYNGNEGTTVIEFDKANWAYTTTFPRAYSWGHGSQSVDILNDVYNYGNSPPNSGKIRFRVDDSSGNAVFGANFINGSENDNTAKVAIALKDNYMSIAWKGTVVFTDTTGNPAIDLVTKLHIGSKFIETTSVVNDYINGHIKSIKYYPVRLTNNQLKALTQ
jgi:hypothetical protein